MRFYNKETCRLCLCLLTLALAFPASAQKKDSLAPSLAISTSRLEIKLDPAHPQAYASLSVLNVGSDPQAILVTMNNWNLDDNNKFHKLPPSPQSLDQWMVVNPLRFTLQPGASQTIRFAVRPRVKPEQGEHRAMVFFNQDMDADINKGKNLVFNIGLPVYAYVGDYHRTTQVQDVQFVPGKQNKGQIIISASNSGNAHSRTQGFFGYWKRDNFPGMEKATAMLRDETRIRSEGKDSGLIYYGKLNPVALLPGTSRKIVTDLAIPAKKGQYYLVISAIFGNAEIAKLIDL